MRTQHLVLSAVLATSAATAVADVTIVSQTAGKASFINIGTEGTTQIKGLRQRNESVVRGKMLASIIDVEGRRFINIDDKKRSAVITPLDSVAEALQGAGVGTMQATLTKTSETKSVASYPCTIYKLDVTMPFSPAGPGKGMDMTLMMSGTACLSTAVPGLADYRAFYKAAAESGFVFGDPRAAKSPTGAAQAKAYAELTRRMAEAGVALESHITITATGDGPLASLMAKVATSDIQSTVTSVTVGEVPADRFDVPAGYKVKEDR